MYPRQAGGYPQQIPQAPPAYVNSQAPAPPNFVPTQVHLPTQDQETLRALFKLRCLFAVASAAFGIGLGTLVYGILYITIDGYGDRGVGIGLTAFGGVSLFVCLVFGVWGVIAFGQYRTVRNSSMQARNTPATNAGQTQFGTGYSAFAYSTQPQTAYQNTS